jgi:hypothetical protein
MTCQHYAGPLNARAAGPGYRLLESERSPKDLEFGEDMLYTAAIRAGWLSGENDEITEIPDVEITVGITRRQANVAATSAHPKNVTKGDAMAHQPALRAFSEDMLVQLARQVAARNGDPDPELIQHASGTREAVTRTTGSIVISDAPSYIIAMKGHFRTPRPRPPGGAPAPEDAYLSYPVHVLIVDSTTGAVTDSGSSQVYPDLSPLGPVVTHYRTPA